MRLISALELLYSPKFLFLLEDLFHNMKAFCSRRRVESHPADLKLNESCRESLQRIGTDSSFKPRKSHIT